MGGNIVEQVSQMNRKYLLSTIVIAALMIVTSFSVMSPTGSSVEQPEKAYVVMDPTIPNCTITSPTSDSTYLTKGVKVSLSGTASDDVKVVNVTWINAATSEFGKAYLNDLNWSISVIALIAGDNLISVTAHDADEKTKTATLTVTRDSTVPTCTITSPTSSPTYSTASGTATIDLGGSASDANGIATVTWKNTATSASGTATGTIGWSITDIALNAGMNSIYVNATDNAGNKGSDAIFVTYDTGGVSVAITDPTANPTLITTWGWTYLKGTAADNVKVTSVTWSNSLGGSGTAYGTTSWQSKGSVQLFAGANVITVTAYDAAGNSATDTLTVTYDNVSPTCTITSPTSSPTYSTASTTIDLGGSASDANGIATVTWKNTATGASGTANGTTSWSITGIALNAGMNSIYVNATDNAGNKGSDAIFVTSDTGGVSVAITAPTANPTLITAWSAIYLEGLATDNVKVTSVTWSNSAGGSGTAYMTPQYGGASVTWKSRGNVSLYSGDNVITVTAYDAAGNSATDTLTVTVNPPELVPPVVTITGPTSNPTMTTGWHYIKLNGTATDNTKVTSVTWTNSLGGSGTAYMNPQWGGKNVMWQSRGNVLLYTGDNVITVTATDSNGNTATDVLTITYTGL